MNNQLILICILTLFCLCRILLLCLFLACNLFFLSRICVFLILKIAAINSHIFLRPLVSISPKKNKRHRNFCGMIRKALFFLSWQMFRDFTCFIKHVLMKIIQVGNFIFYESIKMVDLLEIGFSE